MNERVHATTVAIKGRGVMILGTSGSGKSDLALRLIDRGAMLVSDDYTEVLATGERLHASPPQTIAGRIEVRGLGIIERDYLARVAVALVIYLGEAVDRMPDPRHVTIGGVLIPAVALDAFGASAAIKVEIALARLVEGQT